RSTLKNENYVNHLFLHCRPGFEKECAAEISELADELEVHGYIKTKDNSAYVIFVAHEPNGAERLIKEIRFRQLIFVRQWFVSGPPLNDLPVKDRVTPLVAAANSLPVTRELMVETVD